MIHGEYVTQIR